MPLFLHSPTNRIIETSSPSQTRRYRRHHAFTELDPTDIDTDNHYHSLKSDADSTATTSDSPTTRPSDRPVSSHIDEDAPHKPEPAPMDVDTTDIANHTVSEVLAWVGDNPDRARQALDAEKADRNRVTLTSKLRRIR